MAESFFTLFKTKQMENKTVGVGIYRFQHIWSISEKKLFKNNDEPRSEAVTNNTFSFFHRVKKQLLRGWLYAKTVPFQFFPPSKVSL